MFHPVILPSLLLASRVVETFVDDIAEDNNDQSDCTEDNYIDPYTADVIEFGERYNAEAQYIDTGESYDAEA